MPTFIPPPHLSNIDIVQTRAPVDTMDCNLPFSAMNHEMFELFCCELIHKIHENQCVQFDAFSIGVKGQKQYGADIFVKTFNNDKYFCSLYEVKREKKYNVTKFKRAVQRFIDNYSAWKCKPDQFYLIVAENVSSDSINQWIEHTNQLEELSVRYTIVTPYMLQEWVKDFPGLVFKFFHPAWVRHFFGDATLWRFENYGQFSFVESGYWEDYKEPEYHIGENECTIKNDHIYIHAYLPGLTRPHASCFIEFRNGRFSYVLITLNHQQLVETYFVGITTPLHANQRPFLIKNYRNDDYYCDIGNCRLSLSKAEVECLCHAIDWVWKRYYISACHIENVLGTRDFKFSSYSFANVPLIQIKRSLWASIIEFSFQNCIHRSSGKWSIFDSTKGMLKVFTNYESDEIAPGYHVFIEPMPATYLYSDYFQPEDEVILSWRLPNEIFPEVSEEEISPRYYWDALTSYRWLTDILIPEVLNWKKNMPDRQESRFGIFKKKHRSDTSELKNYYTKSFYNPQPELDITSINSIENLLRLVSILHSFFHGRPCKFIADKNALRSIFNALHDTVKHCTFQDYRFLGINLGNSQVSSIEELKMYILNKSKTFSGYSVNSFEIACILDCFLVCIRDSDCFLNEREAQSVANSFSPLVTIYQQHSLLIRQKTKVHSAR